MRWSVFAIAAFIMVVAQLSLGTTLKLHSVGSIQPDLVACLAVFIVLFAERWSALWACWILGLVMDLAPSESDAHWHLVGPHAIGYVFGGYLVLQLRAMVFRRRALTAGFVTCLFLLATGVVATFLLTVRSWYVPDTPLAMGPLGLFWRWIKVALYTGIIGVPLGWLLQLTIVMWGFTGGASRRSW